MKPLAPGRWLTHDEMIRLTAIESVSRQKLIEHIAAQLRKAARAMRLGLTPRDWYRGIK
jgi:hypothetical protein